MSRKTVLLFPRQGAYRGRYATGLEYPVEVFGLTGARVDRRHQK